MRLLNRYYSVIYMAAIVNSFNELRKIIQALNFGFCISFFHYFGRHQR